MKDTESTTNIIMKFLNASCFLKRRYVPMYMYSSLNTIIKIYTLVKFKSDSLPQGLIAVGPAGREDKYKIRNPTEPTTGRWPSAGDQKSSPKDRMQDMST